MTQKERGLIVLKTIILSATKSKLAISKDFLLEKIDACLDLARPEVLLDIDAKKIYEEIIEKLRKKGKII